MKNLIFSCFKISASTEFELIKQFFLDIPAQKWKSFLLLGDKQIGQILKHPVNSKKAYIFEFGCITLVNFTEVEQRTFLNFLEQILGKIDFNLVEAYFDQHKLEIDDEGLCKLYKTSDKKIAFEDYMEQIIAVIIAKSIALNKIEEDVTKLLDESEKYIKSMQKGIVNLNSRKLEIVTSKILHFEYYVIHNIRIFEKTENFNSIEQNEIYKELSDYYELHDRGLVVKEKINNLKGNIKKYSVIAYKKAQKNQYLVELFLFALFPIFYLIQILQTKNNVFDVIARMLK